MVRMSPELLLSPLRQAQDSPHPLPPKERKIILDPSYHSTSPKGCPTSSQKGESSEFRVMSSEQKTPLPFIPSYRWRGNYFWMDYL
jgi:hypothetical protein